MKHATAQALIPLADLLGSLRQIAGLTERRPGIFYRAGRAYLHFHEDPAGLFADVRLTGDGFDRFAVNTPAEQRALLAQIKAAG